MGAPPILIRAVGSSTLPVHSPYSARGQEVHLLYVRWTALNNCCLWMNIIVADVVFANVQHNDSYGDPYSTIISHRNENPTGKSVPSRFSRVLGCTRRRSRFYVHVIGCTVAYESHVFRFMKFGVALEPDERGGGRGGRIMQIQGRGGHARVAHGTRHGRQRRPTVEAESGETVPARMAGMSG